MPWLWRNYVLFGTPTLGTNMGLNLYIGSHPDASGTFDVAIVPAQLTNPNLRLNEAQVDQIFLQEAIAFATTHPLEALLILPRKVIQLYLLEVTAAESLLQNHPLWLKYGMYGIAQIFYLPILILFGLRLLNLFEARLRPQGIQWTGWLIAIYFTLLTLVFFGVDRYRLPFFPWMIIEASVMLLQIYCPRQQNAFFLTTKDRGRMTNDECLRPSSFRPSSREAQKRGLCPCTV